MIGVMVKDTAQKVEKRKIKNRSFKNFNEKDFDDAVGRVPFHAAYVFEDIDDIYWAHEWLLNDIINEHALTKESVSKVKKPVYKTSKSNTILEKCRRQRNLVNKLTKQSMRGYFFERCAGGPKSKDFWQTIKPFLSKKGLDGSSTIILSENDKIISDQTEFCNTFNNFFINVAKDIGNDCIQYDSIFSNYPSIKTISGIQNFTLGLLPKLKFPKIMSHLNIKKSTGVDDLSAKILKSCANSNSNAVTGLINLLPVVNFLLLCKMLRYYHCIRKRILLTKKIIDKLVFSQQHQKFMNG